MSTLKWGLIALAAFAGNWAIYRLTGHNFLYCTLGVAWMNIAMAFGIFMVLCGLVFNQLIPIALLALGSTVMVPVLIGMGASCH